MKEQISTKSAQLNMSIILGGYLAEKRATATRLGQEPRVDFLELASRLNIPLYEFEWLEQQLAQDRLLSRLVKLYGDLSHWLVFKVFWQLNETDIAFAAGEDTGVPLAILLRLLRRKRPKLIMRLEQPTYGRTRLRSWVYRAVYRLAMPRIDLTMCRTQSHLSLLKSWGASAEQVAFVPETTDMSFLIPKKMMGGQLISYNCHHYLLL